MFVLLLIVVCVIPVKFAPLPTKLVAVMTPAFPNLILLPTSIWPPDNVRPTLCKLDTPVLKLAAVATPTISSSFKSSILKEPIPAFILFVLVLVQ